MVAEHKRRVAWTFAMLVFMSFGCIRDVGICPEERVSYTRNSFAAWENYQSGRLGIMFQRPVGDLNIQEGGQGLSIYMHRVIVATPFPSDPQYLVTISVKKYTNEEWQEYRDYHEKLNERLADGEHRQFRQWAHAVHQRVASKESKGRRYYRRTLQKLNGIAIKVEGEYILADPDAVTDDDAAIRRIISSVTFTN